MSKKFGSDKFDKWDRQLNNWESSEYYYSSDDQDDNWLDEEYEEKEDNYESREYKRNRH